MFIGASVQAVLASSGPVGLTGQPQIDSLIPYLNLGLIVVLLVMFLKNIGIVPKWTYDDLKTTHEAEVTQLKDAHDREVAFRDAQIAALQADKAELKTANDALTKVTQEQFLPALIEANRLTSEYVNELARRNTSGGSP